MGTIQIREMTGGLDARRLPETTPGGVLVRADNGHITRGGEFETRLAFVKEFDVPKATVGLAYSEEGITVFGSDGRPVGMDGRIRHQRLVEGAKTLVRIRDWGLFNGKIYAVAEFEDGTISNYYDGEKVLAWQDTTASVQLRIDSGAITPAVKATAQFQVTAGTGEVINTVTEIRVSGTEILGGPLVHTGNNATTAAAIAARINARPTTPEYTATSSGNTVTLTAARAGAAANGRTITWQTTGNFAIGGATAFAGGANEIVPILQTLVLGSRPLILRPIRWAGSSRQMAAAVADAINVMTPETGFRAFVSDQLIYIRSVVGGTAFNGLDLIRTTTGPITTSLPAGSVTAGGANQAANRYDPAEVALTVRDRVFAGSGTNLHYSALENPAYWQPGGSTAGQIGAGFLNVAASNSSSGQITALARYFDKLAVFTGDTVQTWFIDPDPDLIVQAQVLENTGTDCPRSVTQFGDADIFYLDTSGLRSLRARDSSNAAASTDVGVPIDDILAARLKAMTQIERRNVIGLINPADKRFWLIMGSEIFVYSYYPNSKVNAWTRYDISTTVGDVTKTLNVTDAMVFNRQVFLRTDEDEIYSYGGRGLGDVYDDTRAVAWLPMLDADAPTAEKDWRGLDAALTGRWTVSVSFDPNRADVQDEIANLTETTFGLRRVPMKGRSTHVGLRFESRGGPGKLSAMVIHFDGKVNDD